MAESVSFKRTPYIVQYRTEEGELKSIRRVPPPKLHPFLPEDVVTISKKRSDNWDAEEEVKVDGVNERQPNTLWVEKADGRRTFLPYSDVRAAARSEADVEFADEIKERRSDPLGSDYLLWP